MMFMSGETWDLVAVDADDDNDRYPSITSEYWWGSQNWLYISYERHVFKDAGWYKHRDLMFAKSTNHGETWLITLLRGTGEENVYHQSSITATHGSDGNDYIYVAYTKGNETYVSPYIAPYYLYVDVSRDHGSSWTQKLVYDGHIEEEMIYYPSIAATHGGGTVLVVWEGRDEMRYAYSTNDGRDWTPGSLETETIVSKPALTVDGQGSTGTSIGGYVHAIYEGHYEVWYTRAPYDNPSSWSEPQIASDNNDEVLAMYWNRGLGITTRLRGGEWYPCAAWTDARDHDPRPGRGEDYNIYYSTPGATYTIDTEPSGLQVEVDGSDYTAPASFSWPAGYTHIINAPSLQSPTSDVRHEFGKWSDGGAQLHSITVGTVDTTITAVYGTWCYVLVEQSGCGVPVTAFIDGVEHQLPKGFWWENRTGHSISVPLIYDEPAMPQKRYTFAGWSGLAYSTSETITLFVTTPGTLTVNYKTRFLVTFDQSGSGGVPHVTIGGIPYNLPKSFWLEDGSSREFSYETSISGGIGIQYVLTSASHTSPITVTGPTTVTGYYKTQYYLTVNSPYATPSGAGWYDENSLAYATLDTEVVSGGTGIQHVFTHWSGNASGTDYAQSDPITMDAPKNAEARWKTQYQLTIDNGGHGTTSPASGNWYDAGAEVTITMNSDTTSNTTDTRYLLSSWTGTGLGSYTGSENPCVVEMNAPITETASWKAQYYLNVTSPYGTKGGAGWYDSGSTAHATLDTGTINGTTGIRYVFIQWSDDASGTDYTQSNSISMNGPKTATASWKTQYYFTIETDPTGLSPKPTVSPTGLWYDSGTQVNLTAEKIEDYKFDHWDIDGTAQDPSANPISLTMDEPHTTTAHYTTVAPTFPLWWLVVIILIIAAATVTFILVRKRILRPKTTAKPKPSK